MKSDFHYECIRVLAERAGLSPAEADILAYASQYTDHATEHKPISVENLPPEAAPLVVDGEFNPICTAHESLQYVTQWRSKDAQRKVYIAFHFIPPAAHSAGKPFDFIVQPDSSLARQLVTDALATYPTTVVGTVERLRCLIRTGIALHSYADTWAHQNFSGRWSPTDNDVQYREIWENGSWNDLSLPVRLGLDIAPDIGHAEMANMPDDSTLRYRYRRESNHQIVERDNPTQFLQAARAIYDLIRSSTGAEDGWATLRPLVERCLSEPKQWGTVFADVFSTGGYDRLAWRREALEGDRHDWDKMSGASEFAQLRYNAGPDVKWFLYHVEASKQRSWVLGQIEGARL